MRLALIATLSLLALACGSTVQDRSHDEFLRGPIQRQFEASSAALSTKAFSERCASLETKSDVTEIAIEHAPCFGVCPIYTLVLRADGSAEYLTVTTSKVGILNSYSYQQLAHAAEEIGYFDLDSQYACSISDEPTVYISVVKNGVRKTIQHYSPENSGPTRLLMFEQLIDRVMQHVEWKWK